MCLKKTLYLLWSQCPGISQNEEAFGPFSELFNKRFDVPATDNMQQKQSEIYLLEVLKEIFLHVLLFI